MGADHAAWADTLGARRLHEIHPDDFQHRRARQAHIHGHEEAAQGDRGQDQVLGDVRRARQAGQPGTYGFHAEGGQPAQHDRKQQDAHQRQPEQRRGVQQQRAGHDRAVDPAALVAIAGLGGDHAQEHAQHNGEYEGAGHQQESRRQALHDQVQNRHVVAVGKAQVQLDHALQATRNWST
ncbi:hypothetical protein G6F35_015164 [Rhizopus arrhizus]|nr:hypothetical protein G6F35_015164 [Rhizopus arrhizus]